MDIYDGENEPAIFHGKTLTSKVSLREVCEVIAKYGFVASPYPIIISAEVHCSLPQQDLIAEIMIEVFGDTLVRMPYGDSAGRPKINILPSPEDLKGKILLKTKNPELNVTEISESENGFTSEPSSSASDSDAVLEALQDASVASASTGPSLSSAGTSTPINMKHNRSQSDQIKGGYCFSICYHPELESSAEQFLKARSALLQHVRGAYGGSTSTPESMLDVGLSQSPLSDIVMSPTATTPLRVKSKISSSLLNLLVYTVGVKCRGINKKEEYAPEHMFSLSENAANKMLRFNMWDLIKHTKSHLVRIYPKGTRVSSTNYEPHKFWATGAQLVALNWQTPGKSVL